MVIHTTHRAENIPHVENMSLDETVLQVVSIRGVESKSRFPGDKGTKRVGRGRPLRKMEY